MAKKRKSTKKPTEVVAKVDEVVDEVVEYPVVPTEYEGDADLKCPACGKTMKVVGFDVTFPNVSSSLYEVLVKFWCSGYGNHSQIYWKKPDTIELFVRGLFKTK